MTSNEVEMTENSSSSPEAMSVGDENHIDCTQPDVAARWTDIKKVLGRSGPDCGPGFVPNFTENINKLLNEYRILVIGAGGLGCELLKNLALSGFRQIEVIDMDTIDVSNLNRQFLFRQQDVGKPKATVAAAFINNRVSNSRVVPHYAKIQDYDESFYKRFKMIVCGLDSIDARRWINSLLVSLVEYDDDGVPDIDTIIPMVDGGTEGWKGQARVIIPGLSACFECSIQTFPPQKTYPICTIANTPRIPEHCIQWASIIFWDESKPFKGADGNPVKIDTDSFEHMHWLYERANERAHEFGIEGVTYKLTQGVVKNIIPAIASTNAVISAACANEAFKFATECGPALNNWQMYNGAEGVYTYTFEYEQKEDCAVCGSIPMKTQVSGSKTLEEFLEQMADDPSLQLKAPSIRCEGKSWYMQKPVFLEQQTRPNLKKKIVDLCRESAAKDSGMTDSSGEGAMTVELNIAAPSLKDATLRLLVEVV